MKPPLSCLFCFFTLLFSFSTHLAWGHEYYLMPESFNPASGSEFAVRHRLGQKFKGNEVPYIGAWNIRSEVWADGKMQHVKGADGDRPALRIKTTGAGLMSIIHESNVEFLTFKTWEKFTKYAIKEGLEHAMVASEQGRKPKEGIKEAYARFAKTLVAPNGGKSGSDHPTGLKIELVALAHPMALKADQPMPVQLLYRGEPLGGARVKVFVGTDTEFVHQIRTDSAGKVLIPAGGPGPYLLNAIHMTEPQGKRAKERNAHWESFWASLTFQRAE